MGCEAGVVGTAVRVLSCREVAGTCRDLPQIAATPARSLWGCFVVLFGM